MDLNPDTVFIIIDKAQEFHVKEQVTIPEEPLSPSDDWARQVLADHADDPVLQELVIAIDDLEPDQQVTLVAIMWVGRGDFSADEWDKAVENAQDSWNERSAQYLIGTPLVADYLRMGMEELGYTRG